MTRQVRGKLGGRRFAITLNDAGETAGFVCLECEAETLPDAKVFLAHECGVMVDTTTHGWSVDEARAAIEIQDDPTVLDRWHDGERAHPSHEGGRKGVKDAIEERRGELGYEEPAEGLARGPQG